MAHIPQRQSILHRPVHSQPSKAFETTAEAQYQKEQERLKAKALKSNSVHERILKSLYPTPEDKAAAAQQAVQDLEAARISRSDLACKDQARDSGVTKVLPVDDQPWQNPSLVYRDPQEEKLARRIYEQQVAAVNKGMMEEASLRRAMAQEQELEEGRRALKTQTFWNVGSRAGDRFAPSGLREPSAASTPVVAPYAQDTETPIMSAPVSRGSYSGNYAAAGVPAAGYTAPTAAAGRRFPGANSSSLMEHVLQQRDLDTHPAYATAAPAEFAAPTAADYDMYDFPPTDAPRPQYIAAPPAPLPPMAPVSAGRLVTPYATGYGADQTVGRASVPRASSIPASAYVAGGADGNAVMRAAGLGGVGGAERLGSRSSAVPYATADNNEAYRAAPPPPRAGRGDAGGVAPFATADSSAPYAPARAASAGSAPFATDDAIAAAAGGAPIGLRYAAARSAVAGRRAGVPWATDDDGDGAAGAGVIYPATAAVSRRGTGQAPPVVTSMSQILGGASAAPLIANGRRQNSFTRM